MMQCNSISFPSSDTTARYEGGTLSHTMINCIRQTIMSSWWRFTDHHHPSFCVSLSSKCHLLPLSFQVLRKHLSFQRPSFPPYFLPFYDLRVQSLLLRLSFRCPSSQSFWGRSCVNHSSSQLCLFIFSHILLGRTDNLIELRSSHLPFLTPWLSPIYSPPTYNWSRRVTHSFSRDRRLPKMFLRSSNLERREWIFLIAILFFFPSLPLSWQILLLYLCHTS